MTLDELFITLLNLLIAGFVLSVVAAVLFILFSVMEWLRCRFHNIPFETAGEDLCRFYTEGFLPTMSVLFVTLMVLKFFLSAKGG